MKSLIAIICILGLIGTGVGIEVFGADNLTISATITARNISITRTVGNGSIAYGSVDLSSSTSTLPSAINDVETYQNDGSITEKFSVKTSDASGGTAWTASTAIGGDTFVHSFATNTAATWQIIDTADSYEFASTTVDTNATLDFYFKIDTPDSTTDYQQKTITITVLAEQG